MHMPASQNSQCHVSPVRGQQIKRVREGHLVNQCYDRTLILLSAVEVNCSL